MAFSYDFTVITLDLKIIPKVITVKLHRGARTTKPPPADRQGLQNDDEKPVLREEAEPRCPPGGVARDGVGRAASFGTTVAQFSCKVYARGLTGLSRGVVPSNHVRRAPMAVCL